MIKILFLSFSAIIKDYDRLMHVDFVRIKEYYKSFIEYGNKVDSYYVDKEGNIVKNNIIFNIEDIPLLEYDLIFIYHEETIARLFKKYNKEQILYFLRKIPSNIQMDCSLWGWAKDNDIISSFKNIGIAHPYSYLKLSHKFKYLIHNASIKRETYLEKNINSNIIYMGRIKKVLDKLKIFSNNIKNKKIDLYTFDSEQKEYINNKNIIFNNPIKYNEIGSIWGESFCGLCFCDGPTPCGKIWDYLAYGIPVLCEEGIGEYDIIKDNKLGYVFNINKWEYNLDIMNSFDNKEIFEYIQENHLWKHRVKQWINILV